MILPCPAFGPPPPFLLPPLAEVADVDVGSCNFFVAAGGRGSSSEKDSQVGSSCVTGVVYSFLVKEV